MDRLFLDANVLFAAAFKSASPIRRLWELPNVELWTSEYVIDEAVRNLREKRPERSEELQRLLRRVRSVLASPGHVPGGVSLPEKDLPVLLAAVAARATHLLTGDKNHFGRYYGQVLDGVLILRPRDYVPRRE